MSVWLQQLENIAVLTLHPGLVNTNISRPARLRFGITTAFIANVVLKKVGKTAKEGAQTTINSCIDENLPNSNASGHY